MTQARVAAASLAYLFGDGGLKLNVLSQTQSTITLGWNPVPGAVGYRFTSAGMAKPSHTWDPLRSSVKFQKALWYRVEALSAPVSGSYP